MARLSTSRCQPTRAARRDHPVWVAFETPLRRSRQFRSVNLEWALGRTGANLRFDGYAGLSNDESPWPSTAFRASSSSVSRHVATTDSDHDQPPGAAIVGGLVHVRLRLSPIGPSRPYSAVRVWSASSDQADTSCRRPISPRIAILSASSGNGCWSAFALFPRDLTDCEPLEPCRSPSS